MQMTTESLCCFLNPKTPTRSGDSGTTDKNCRKRCVSPWRLCAAAFTFRQVSVERGLRLLAVRHHLSGEEVYLCDLRGFQTLHSAAGTAEKLTAFFKIRIQLDVDAQDIE